MVDLHASEERIIMNSELSNSIEYVKKEWEDAINSAQPFPPTETEQLFRMFTFKLEQLSQHRAFSRPQYPPLALLSEARKAYMEGDAKEIERSFDATMKHWQNACN
jgi:hypothetical protein